MIVTGNTGESLVSLAMIQWTLFYLFTDGIYANDKISIENTILVETNVSLSREKKPVPPIQGPFTALFLYR